MKFNNYSVIESIEFPYLEFMSSNSEKKAIELFNFIKDEKAKIMELRTEANSREKALKEAEKKWNYIKNQATIKYGSYEKETIKNNPNLYFNMSAEINKNVH